MSHLPRARGGRVIRICGRGRIPVMASWNLASEGVSARGRRQRLQIDPNKFINVGRGQESKYVRLGDFYEEVL